MNRDFIDRLDGTQHCRDEDLDLFFPPRGGAGSTDKAKAICRGCPLLMPCLDYALARDLYGVWGATTQDERRTYQKDRGIRPIPVPHRREKSTK